MNKAADNFHGSQCRRLIPIFVAWKFVLLVLAAFSPGPGYDTSGLILLGDSEHRLGQIQSPSLVDRLALSHLRWDALYFVKAAQRGYLYEQEWAFSKAYSLILDTITDCFSGEGERPLKYYVWTGIAMSNLFHLISVLILYRLARAILGPKQDSRIPFIASVLHIITPAGIFLSAPYAESLFSALNFTGMLHYVLARQSGRAAGKWTVTQDSYMISSGILFACATAFRSNGLLSGLIFLYDVASSLPRIFTRELNVHEIRRLCVTCVAGVILALAFIIPQFLAYQEYCSPDNSDMEIRPWCEKTIPSIYSWVQSHYWNVGFLRYWNISNLPLFLIAAPMLWLLSSTSMTVLQQIQHHPGSQSGTLGFYDFPQLAIPQLVLTVAATTNFHVQIINRISSGYPLWYLIIARWITSTGGAATTDEKKDGYAKWVVRGMVMYAIVQGMLFASFLPPA